jgi:sigma-E factor negative regulatory protein RseA
MKQQISECMDGELDAQAAHRVFSQVAESAEYRAEWTIYHMIGDGMRDAPDLRMDFVERVTQRLAAEPTVLAPKPILPSRAGFANYAMYAAASLAAVAVVGWIAFVSEPAATQLARNDAAPMIAKADRVKADPVRPKLSPLNSRDHDYLLAHQAVSPSGPMLGVAPYVRTVSFGTEANGR